ncbi:MULTISPECIES: efflux RND transporter permease subunit [Pseudoalteromonas]|jgi:HAE1 family hydrophobic/amphiphilic exporter-1/multidrug efflux pump|uniref:Efflux pump membrane transporter n=1 Tax=Pseudoalteromonas lipolytica TaxID=570156 RepID=A0AAD0WCI2_9GAMM|nr:MULTISPECIES: multidrug efflux RND transporter permease subunit [Pseudoalteromonas]AXV65468.1 multidrug efflux RND transporter permease subunit [Pseudoalteromonas donghaensis]EWH06957.1 RND transporter [Pseudoalteromonas lipolytica SCSIO 04301]MBE0350716.1 multidrug efflux pump [Pseudoalteromonas lipolytica LMEB 39]MCC9658970.1 multidrug efflux RND transporter permease subunit [Pseudoalteromonas sp. MB41]QLJ07012.1 multidrug efflux RND transporter permease subunit [Pseudoalteromonas sp. JST|tara:strand:- start:10552 stop:13725 length:3174 start_codon:yes stop_codon:yes gene_type:complete
MFSRYFIDRPIFAFVISIVIVLAGLAAMRSLPIAQYPEIAPPVVQVTAAYPGASADVLEQTVAAPIENAITGVEGMMYMSSTSTSAGSTTIEVTFEIGTDVDQAAVNVNNRVKQVEARLPEETRRQGVVVQKGSSSFLQVHAFYSPDGSRSSLWTSNYVTMNVLDRVKRIPGTTSVQIFGAKDYAMRIWLRPDVMSQLGVTVEEVAGAIRVQNSQYAAGKIGATPTASSPQELVYSVTAQGRLSEPEQFENIIIRSNPDGSSLRLKDVARVELGSKDYNFKGTINGKEAVLLGIFLQPGANALDVADEVNTVIEEMKSQFPTGLSHLTSYDTTRFVEVSIREVVKTLLEAMVLVFLVVYLFLQNWRATLIPTLAVPVSLLGTFAGMYMLGYSINSLTLFGMVLSIGIVVDDAIVVLENVERIMHEEHLSAREAAIKAMREVSGPVVAIVLVLCSVFVPIAFLGGLTGELFRQFAITISIAVSLSGVVALTMTPALCVLILKQEHKQTARFFLWFNATFTKITSRYVGAVGFMVRRGLLGLILMTAMIAATIGLWQNTPGSLVPDEDQGYYISAIFLPDGSSLERTEHVTQQVVKAVQSNPANENVVAFTGFDFIGGGYKNSAATLFVTQKHWDEREVDTKALVQELFMKTAGIKEALVLAFNPPAIFGLGNTGGFEFYIQNKGDSDPDKLQQAMQLMTAEAQKSPIISGLQTLWRPDAPQLRVDVDREQARAMGVEIDDAFTALAGNLGTYYVNDFNKFGRAWQVLMSADAEFRMKPDDIKRIYVKNNLGNMVPLSAFTTIEYSRGPENLNRYNNLPAVKLMGNAAPGYSSGQAIAEVERIANAVLPPNMTYEWTGSAYQEKRSSGTTGIALGLAVIMVFLILAALYERWSLPLSVMLALPFGTFGALIAVWLVGMTNDVYFQIGLVTLLGLASKNAILIVEYALMKHQQGWSASTAALEAARLRFRPIIMTSLAFILGVVPLVLSSGAGAGARHSVGTGVMGGMMAATFLAVFFVPLFFYWLTERKLTEKRSRQELADEIAAHHKQEHVDTQEGNL